MNIVLKEWSLKSEEDIEGLIKICNAADRRYLANRLPYPYTEKDAQWWLDMVEQQEGKEGIFRAIVVDGEYAGNISVEKKNDVYAKDAEIGYLLLTDKWSKGIMTEAVRQICGIAFSHLDILRITGLVYEPNEASKRVLEKNGFAHEGTMKDAVYKNDKVYDLCIYGKYKEKI